VYLDLLLALGELDELDEVLGVAHVGEGELDGVVDPALHLLLLFAKLLLDRVVAALVDALDRHHRGRLVEALGGDLLLERLLGLDDGLERRLDHLRPVPVVLVVVVHLRKVRPRRQRRELVLRVCRVRAVVCVCVCVRWGERMLAIRKEKAC
jgi:hypothetical protein